MRLIAILLILFISGCCHCPPQDLFFFAHTMDGRFGLVPMEEGYFDDRDNWMSKEDMKEFLQCIERPLL